jgi:NAD(P) transhydrogenase subunit alpha
MTDFLDWIALHEQIIFIVILMVFVGIEVIGRVPSVLHTPLMSGANAIHGVVLIGAIIVLGKTAPDNYLALVLGFLAVVLGTLNVVGGFVVTDRMLEMFKKKKKQ